jgi:hypothetical protein
VADDSIATIATSPTPLLTAVGPGTVTVTATWQGLTASTEVTVVSAEAITAGTTVWSAPPIGGSVDKIVQGAPGPDGQSQIYVVEGTVLRALSTDGADAWAQEVGTVTQLSGDPLGGAVAFIEGTEGGPAYVLKHFDVDGRVTEQAVPNASRGWKDAFAISPDGVVYLVECASGECSLTSKDIGMGGGITVPLPTGTLTMCTDGTAEAPTGCTSAPASFGVGTPTIMEDGRVAVPVVTGDDQVFIDPENSQQSEIFAPTMSVLFVDPVAGERTVQVVPWESLYMNNLTAVWPNKVIPNGDGGVFVTWTGRYSTDTQRFGAKVAALSADGTPSGGETLGEMWGDLVVGENGVALASTYLGAHQRMVTAVGPGGYAIHSPDFYGSDVDVTSMVAEQGGSFVTSFSGRAMLGSDDGYDAMPLAHATFVGENTWIGIHSGSAGIVGMFGPSLSVASGPWPLADADEAGTNAARRPTCTMPTNPEQLPQPLAATHSVLAHYKNMKTALLNSGTLDNDNPASAACMSFLTDPNYTLPPTTPNGPRLPDASAPNRAAFFRSLLPQTANGYDMTPIRDAVVNQQPYDGPRTFTSKYKAGYVSAERLASTDPDVINADSALKNVPVCGTWTKWRNTVLRKWVSPKGNPQAEAPVTSMTPTSQKATAVYLNSTMIDKHGALNKQAQKFFTAGTILHEALHNFTGLYDDELQDLFGVTRTDKTVETTYKLKAVGCAK